MAISLLAAMGEVPMEPLGEVMLAGELSLDGKVNGVPGVLPMALAARDFGMKYMILPKENRREGELVPGITTVAVSCIREAVAFLTEGKLPPESPWGIRRFYPKSPPHMIFQISAGRKF